MLEFMYKHIENKINTSLVHWKMLGLKIWLL